MKSLLFACTILAAGAIYASGAKEVKSLDFGKTAWNNMKDTVPQDTSDTTHKPDSIFLADFLAKN